MKTRIITLLTVCLFILSMLSSCTESKTTEAPKGPETIPNPSSHSETKTEEVQRDPEVPRSDSLRPYLGTMTGNEDLPEGFVRLYRYPWSPGYTVLEAIVTGAAESYFYSFPENEEEQAILYYHRGAREAVGTIDRAYALNQVKLLYEVWETPQKFFAQDVKVQNVYGMSEIFALGVYLSNNDNVYHAVTANCVHFAIGAWNLVSTTTIPTAITLPVDLYNWIEKRDDAISNVPLISEHQYVGFYTNSTFNSYPWSSTSND